MHNKTPGITSCHEEGLSFDHGPFHDKRDDLVLGTKQRHSIGVNGVGGLFKKGVTCHRQDPPGQRHERRYKQELEIHFQYNEWRPQPVLQEQRFHTSSIDKDTMVDTEVSAVHERCSATVVQMSNERWSQNTHSVHAPCLFACSS